ncbi:hypothetical protein PJE062_1119 [Pseudovibrio sp. JE062]|nr:hypothetical protein PJE062_1119 [Pseudovibrio sp. JE062]
MNRLAAGGWSKSGSVCPLSGGVSLRPRRVMTLSAHMPIWAS